MAIIRKIDEHFFDRESKRMYYVLGLFYGGYIPQPKNGILYRSKNKGLVEIVKRELKSEHSIVSDRRRPSHWIEADSLPHLRSKIKKWDLDVAKSKRKLPKEIDEEYRSHFVRGLIDSRALIKVRDKGELNIIVSFKSNISFLRDLCKKLKKYAGVRGGYITKGLLIYGNYDSIKIRDFIYKDWNFIKKNELYLKEKRKILERGCVYRESDRTIKAKEKIEKAKKLLGGGLLVQEVAEKLGYASSNSFYICFKNITRECPKKYKKNLA